MGLVRNAIASLEMRERYRRWIYDWESRLTSRDNNRVVRPFDWGLEWTRHWPGIEQFPAPPDQHDHRAPPRKRRPCLGAVGPGSRHRLAQSSMGFGQSSDFEVRIILCCH